MNIKIKAAGIACLIEDDYDKVYVALKKKQGEGDHLLMCERIPGHEYLQWVLPGDQWTPLTECDPLVATSVKQALDQKQQEILSLFGNNKAMAYRVLTVPDSSYIFYKVSPEGKVTVKLTAWGYKYPERVGGGGGSGTIEPEIPKVFITISPIYDGTPIPFKEINLNGYKRKTNASGVLEIGELPVGYHLDIQVDHQKIHTNIQEGMGNIQIDLTRYTTVQIQAEKDTLPYEGAAVCLQYDNLERQLTTDSNGRATCELPLKLNGEWCRVQVEDAILQKELEENGNLFQFQFTTPQQPVTKEPDSLVEEEQKPEEQKPEEPKPEEPKPEEPKQPDIEEPQKEEIKETLTEVAIQVHKNGLPYADIPVFIHYGEQEKQLITDHEGRASCHLPLKTDGGKCRVEVEDAVQEKILAANRNLFDFQFTSLEDQEVTSSSEQNEKEIYVTVQIQAQKDGAAYEDAPVHVKYGDEVRQLKTNNAGLATCSLPLKKNGEQCLIEIDGTTQQKELHEGDNRFDFRFTSPRIPDDDVTLPTSTSPLTYLMEALMGLLLAFLVYLTYNLCYGAFFL